MTSYRDVLAKELENFTNHGRFFKAQIPLPDNNVLRTYYRGTGEFYGDNVPIISDIIELAPYNGKLSISVFSRANPHNRTTICLLSAEEIKGEL